MPPKVPNALDRWRKAAQKEGYMIKGKSFKPTPKKGTRRNISEFNLGQKIVNLQQSMFPVKHNPCKPKGKTLKMTVAGKLSDALPSPVPLDIWHSGILALWHTRPLALSHSRKLALWQSVTLALSDYRTLTLSL